MIKNPKSNQKTDHRDFYIGRSQVRQLVLDLKEWQDLDDEFLAKELRQLGFVHGGIDTENGKLFIVFNTRSTTPQAIKNKLRSLGFRWKSSKLEPANGFEIGFSAFGGFLILIIFVLLIRLWIVYSK